jgi:teichoic acid transport system permease protein
MLNKLRTLNFLVNIEYKAVHRKKFFGVVWKFLNPIIFVLIYTFVFSTLNSGGNRGFIISSGVLIYSGISSSINSSKTWIQPKILSFSTTSASLLTYFRAKLFFNFLPILYLTLFLIGIQRFFFNKDFQFTYFESFQIFLQLNLLIAITYLYCFYICIPISILCKKFNDLNDLISHILRISLYLSPILWTAKTEIEIVNTAMQLFNPLYFLFEILNYIIFRSYEISFISFITPVILILTSHFFYLRNNKFMYLMNKYLYR